MLAGWCDAKAVCISNAVASTADEEVHARGACDAVTLVSAGPR
jgi:hypothetical protein